MAKGGRGHGRPAEFEEKVLVYVWEERPVAKTVCQNFAVKECRGLGLAPREADDRYEIREPFAGNEP